jgi:hypothetical protein
MMKNSLLLLMMVKHKLLLLLMMMMMIMKHSSLLLQIQTRYDASLPPSWIAIIVVYHLLLSISSLLQPFMPRSLSSKA